MNIEAYDLDSLRKIVRTLQKENEALRSQLKKADIAFDAPNPFDKTIESINEYDPDQGERIHGRYITEDLAKRYFACFGVEKMFMPKEERMVDIFRSVITDGVMLCVQNNVVKNILR